MTVLCECGCGEPTSLARQSATVHGYVRGQPVRFRRGHHSRLRRTDGDGPNPSGLCQCGCGEKTPIASRTCTDRGWIKGKPVRFCPRHHRRLTTAEYVVDDGGCWIWQRAKSPEGYGRCASGNAHRMVYEREVGPIPEGHHLHHVCGNRLCVNPAHCAPMTPSEHARHHHETAA